MLAVMLVGNGRPANAAERICSPHIFESTHFTVCTFDPNTSQLTLIRTDAKGVALRRFDRLAKYLGHRAHAV